MNTHIRQIAVVAGLAVLHSVDGPVQAQAMRYGAGLAALWGLSRLPVNMTWRASWSPRLKRSP